MGRWEPNARGRLAEAAWELFLERGYEETTAAEIATRAGLTERTFFRHFADKREVFFAGAEALAEQALRAIAEVPESASALDAVRAAMESTTRLITDREFSRRRQRIILANPDLQERERAKLASLATTLADALRKRGTMEPEASIAAEMGVAIFRIAFERWIAEKSSRDLLHYIRESFECAAKVTLTN